MSSEHKEVDEKPLVRDEEATEAAATALTALSISSKHEEEEDDESFEIPQRFTKSGRKRAVPFPLKVSTGFPLRAFLERYFKLTLSFSHAQLMKVLSTKEFSDIITWTPSGKSFTIVQPKAFVSEILPEHFKSAKYSSFTRKLHRWGFMRHYRGEESGAFYHKDFQKDRLDLVEQMTCKTEPGKSVAAISKKPTAPKKPVQLAAPPAQTPAPLSQGTTSVQSAATELSQLQAPQASVVATQLDAAIEAEVTRRLQERLNQAALSRMFMQQQLNTPVIPLGLRMQLMEMQQKKLTNSLAGPRIALAGLPLRNSQGLGGLPRTNIQGAKTA